ncbi:IS3 family transposase [Rhodococcoides fascians]|uniref:IS3 family transposase n=1 Tax=Rhodococcoides fascians TaxID=1828 RepID=UPI000A07CFE4
MAQTPADPDAALRATLRKYAGTHPLHGFRRAWAHLRHDEGMTVNKKKVHRLWKEEWRVPGERGHLVLESCCP